MLLREVREAAVGRAAFLQGDAPTSKERKKIDALNDAVLLLQSVVDAGWDDAEGTVTRALVEALLNRAVHLSNEYDDEEGARYDARKACALAPRSQRAIAVMVGASLHYARDLFMQGRRGRAEALLKEIQGDLAEGLRIHPGDAVLDGFRGNLAELEATIAGKGSEHLRGVVEKLKVALPGETAADAASRRLSEAMFLENRQDFAGAVAIYRELVEASPHEAGIRNKLAWCYRLWILQELSREGGGPRAREILEEARGVCSNAASLRDLIAAAEGGEEGSR
jgi:tetratricopeptide (TPR) repeat protein